MPKISSRAAVGDGVAARVYLRSRGPRCGARQVGNPCPVWRFRSGRPSGCGPGPEAAGRRTTSSGWTCARGVARRAPGRTRRPGRPRNAPDRMGHRSVAPVTFQGCCSPLCLVAPYRPVAVRLRIPLLIVVTGLMTAAAGVPGAVAAAPAAHPAAHPALQPGWAPRGAAAVPARRESSAVHALAAAPVLDPVHPRHLSVEHAERRAGDASVLDIASPRSSTTARRIGDGRHHDRRRVRHSGSA